MGNLLRALQAHGVAWRKASPFALKCRGVFPGVSSPSRQVSGETPLLYTTKYPGQGTFSELSVLLCILL